MIYFMSVIFLYFHEPYAYSTQVKYLPPRTNSGRDEMTVSLFLFQAGGDCMILPSVSKDDAEKLFPGYKVATVPSGKEYIRTTTQPK